MLQIVISDLSTVTGAKYVNADDFWQKPKMLSKNTLK